LFYRWLIAIGLKPKKSKTLCHLAVPQEVFLDFVRGCFDGDGSIYAYWDRRWHSSYMFYISFASASQPFLDWIRSTLCTLAGIKGHITKGSCVNQLKYAKEESKRLCELMYKDPKSPRLQRKFAKVKKIFRIESAHSKCPGGVTGSRVSLRGI
jgi:hypothetical protein